MLYSKIKHSFVYERYLNYTDAVALIELDYPTIGCQLKEADTRVH